MSDDSEDGTGKTLELYRETTVINKDHGEPMSMAEFASWIENNIGGSVQEALEQSAFMLCCDVIAQDIAKATLRLRERLPNGTSRVVLPTEHEIAGLLALEPNRRHSWIEFVEMSVYWLCLTSNSYIYVKRDRKGDPLELIPLQTGHVRPLVEGADVFYEITASTQQEQALLGASSIRAPERDVIHVSSRMLDGMEGYSTLFAGKKTLDAGKALEKMRESLFAEEGQLRGVFTRPGVTDDTMPDPAFQRLRQQYKILMSRFRQLTEPIVLEGGLEFKQISSNPKDMEFTQQFTAQINATCRLLRVPPHKVFNLDNSKYDNLETQEKDYVSSTLTPVCERFEQRYSKVLLSRKDRLKYIFEHDREEMMLKDTKAETERAVRSLERGAITLDEYRAIIGKNPLPDGQGEVRLIPVNMYVVGKDGKVVIGSAQGPATDAPPEDTPEEQPADEPQKGLRLVKQ